jgi:hypothetical protein
MYESIEPQLVVRTPIRHVPRLATQVAAAGLAGLTCRQFAGSIDAESDWPIAFAVLTPNGAQALAQQLLTHTVGAVQ